VSCGILGLVVHAAAGRGPQPPFVQVMAALFPSVTWLQIKIAFLTYGPLILGIMGCHALMAPAVPFETWAPQVAYWVEPAAEAATLILTVYATPFTVRRRFTGRPGAPLREGLRLLRARRDGGHLPLVLLLPAIAIGTTVDYLRPPTKGDVAPGIAEGLVLLAARFLTLAALFAASRFLARRAEEPADLPGRDEGRRDSGGDDAGGRDAGGRDAAAPGPPAA
jgi:hypothetical protein